jgi:VanZ family protein
MHRVWLFIKQYKFSLLVLAVILFLSFFKPPHTELDEITNFDKVVHFCMYGGFSAIIWLEYLRCHREDPSRGVMRNSGFTVNRVWLLIGALVLPIVLSGGIELAQEYLTTYRGGEWWDFASNSTGVLAASLCGYFFLKGRRRRGRGE